MQRKLALLSLCSVAFSSAASIEDQLRERLDAPLFRSIANAHKLSKRGDKVPAIIDPRTLSVSFTLDDYEAIVEDPSCIKNLTACDDSSTKLWNNKVAQEWLVQSVGYFNPAGFYVNDHSVAEMAQLLEGLVTDDLNFDNFDPYEGERVNRFQQSVIDANDIDSANCLNMPTRFQYLPKIEIYETFPTIRKFYNECLNSDESTFMSFEAMQVDPLTNHTFWMRKNLTSYGFYQFHVVDPIWFDSEAFGLYLKSTKSDTFRDVFTKQVTHYPTEVLWNCRPNATSEFQETDAAGEKVTSWTASASAVDLVLGGFAVKPLFQDQ
jgi:hypothetical protein